MVLTKSWDVYYLLFVLYNNLRTRLDSQRSRYGQRAKCTSTVYSYNNAMYRSVPYNISEPILHIFKYRTVRYGILRYGITDDRWIEMTKR